MTRVTVHQPNYLPWLGFFGKALDADVLVLLDNVQYEKGGYTNRVRIKGSQGPQWLTQPVLTSGRSTQQVREVAFARDDWPRKHLQALTLAYGRAPHFEAYVGALQQLLGARWPTVAACNEALIRWVVQTLNLPTRVVRASDLVDDVADPTERLIALARAVSADTYVSGAGGFGYQDAQAFADAGIRVERSRSAYPAYPQLWGRYVEGLSVVDLLFNCGPDSRAYLDRGSLVA